MQNRKKVNQEIERKKRGQRRLSTIITTVVIAAIVLALVWIVWDVRSRGWIVNFEGNRIATRELQFHAAMTQVNPNDPAERDTLVRRIVETEVLINRAEAAGLGLTAEEREELLPTAQANREQLYPSIPVERVVDLMGLQIFFNRLYEHYATYEPDPTEFARDVAEYIENNREDYELRHTEVQIIVSDDRDALTEIKESADYIDAADFEAFARTTCLAYAEQGHVYETSILELIEMLGLFEHFDELIGLQAGQTSSVIEIDEGEYLLVFMLARPGIEDSEIEEIFRERLVSERSWEVFWDLVDSWVADADYTVNERALAR